MQFVDLVSEYHNLKSELDNAIASVLESGAFIKGPTVTAFESNLSQYLDSKYTIACANGTDALQIALMALDLPRDAEILVPAFTYPATVEVIALLGYTPLAVDVDLSSFNTSVEYLENVITKRTKAVVPVHLYGQGCDMEAIMAFASQYDLYVIEDNAQSIGSTTLSKNQPKALGTFGHIGTTSFFPTKTLGCYGDGGAIFCQDAVLSERIRMIANHGQSKRYVHDIIGVNSRLDALQAAILNVKLQYLDKSLARRNTIAQYYNTNLDGIGDIIIPEVSSGSTHGYHQYTIRTTHRDTLKAYLASQSLPTNIYYALPVYKQQAYTSFFNQESPLVNTETLCQTVLSLPIYPTLQISQQDQIIEAIIQFFKNLE